MVARYSSWLLAIDCKAHISLSIVTLTSIEGSSLQLVAPLAFKSKADAVYDELERRILRGDLPPATTLNQVQLAAMLQVSTTPLRETLRKVGDRRAAPVGGASRNYCRAVVSCGVSGSLGSAPKLGPNRCGLGRSTVYVKRSVPDAGSGRGGVGE